MTPSLTSAIKNLLSKSGLSINNDTATIARGLLESWVAPIDSVTASTATTNLNLNETPLLSITLTTSTTLSLGSPQTGVYVIKLIQGGAGSHTVTFPSSVKWAGGVVPTLTTTAGAWDYITFVYDGEYFSATSILNFVV
jgi:hypothetical protein